MIVALLKKTYEKSDKLFNCLTKLWLIEHTETLFFFLEHIPTIDY